jgi:hypothetical protein
MFSRMQYLNKVCSHRQYYAQFVDAGVLSRVTFHIGKDKIQASTNPHFNDIPLAKWDSLYPAKWDRLYPLVPAHIDKAMRDCGDYPTLAGMVCIAKEAAEQIREGANNV